MKKIVFLGFIIFITNLTFAHAFYFAFAEMEYNTSEQHFEISIRATGHDLEDYMKHLDQTIPPLEEAKNNPIALQKIEKLISQEFSIKVDAKNIRINLIGIEINNKDEVILYIVSNKIKPADEIEVKFDLLMNHFPEQQNKLTYIHQDEKSYYSFLPHKRNRIISLKP